MLSNIDVRQAETVLAELRRRYQERALERYVPSSKQVLLHGSRAKIVLFLAANGVGKTTCAVAEAVAQALGYRPWTDEAHTLRVPPTNILLCCRDFTHAADEDLLPVLDKFLPKSMVKRWELLANGKRHKCTLTNGSTIKIMSYEQAAMAFEGSMWHVAVFNEPPPRQVWIAVSRGLAKAGGRAYFAMTPIGVESAWIYDELYQKADPSPEAEIQYIHATLEDSFMPDDDKRLFEDNLDEDEREARVHGRFRHLVGRIYKRFDPGVHVLTGDHADRVDAMVADPSIPKGICIDPHDRRPCAMAYFLVDPVGSLIFYREWPDGEMHHEIRSSSSTVADHAKWMGAQESEMPSVVWRLMDPNFGPKRNAVTGESIADAFAKEGFVFDTQINDALADGHLAVKARLDYDHHAPVGAENHPSLYFHERCVNSIWSLNRYAWKGYTEDGKYIEKPAEVGKDFMDVVRYTCMTVDGYFNPTALRLDYQRLPSLHGAI